MSQSQAAALAWDVTRNGSAVPWDGCPGPAPALPIPVLAQGTGRARMSLLSSMVDLEGSKMFVLSTRA